MLEFWNDAALEKRSLKSHFSSTPSFLSKIIIVTIKNNNPNRFQVNRRKSIMNTYYNPDDLAKFAEIGEDAPELWKKFSAWYGEVFQPGALSEREKALIALAVAHAIQCPYCIDAYTQASLEKGSNPEQMMEAIHVAAAIRGGASLVHGVQMRNVEQKLGAI
jgi:alkylhydroperoxidase/carboxymuconolactone decarboxylase family protein